MSSKPTTQRAIILESVRTMIESLFGSVSGTVQKVFRKVERKAWTPGETMRPSAVINDDGESRSGSNNTDTTKSRVLKFQVILNLDAAFGSASEVIDWTDIVAALIARIQNYNPKAGLLRMDVLDDTPIKAEMITGAESLWVIECECEYFIDVQAFSA